MRLNRREPVAGLDPELARQVTRVVHSAEWPSTALVAHYAHLPDEVAADALAALAAEGFLTRRDTPDHRRLDEGSASVDEWATTIRGGALSQASFLKPISRAKAQALLDGVLERAAAFNADPDKVMWVERIAVFGSFIDPDAVDYGDIDLQLTLTDRFDRGGRERSSYIRVSRRRFPNIIQELFWPETEAKQILRNRSPYISLHDEDVSRFTDKIEVIYEFTPPPEH
jgi:hypothetical protein